MVTTINNTVLPIYAMEYHSAIKMNEIGAICSTGMDIGIVTEVKQDKEDKYHSITCT